jgi:acyl transferase domain-containing protein
VATLVVKRLKDAVADGDPIRAVIRESSLNQDGKTETITTPSIKAQEALIRDCYGKAGLRPEDTQYFEAHGTGTQAGDTIEARAIATVFGEADSRRGDPLLIGSVKTNIGHTEAVSGLASIIKTALAMERGLIPASINFDKPNPKIPLEDWNLKLVRDLTSWPPASSRRASINNFGYGGTNSHIIMESSTSWIRNPADDNRRVNGASTNGTAHLTGGESKQVLVLSAKDQSACQRMVSNLKQFLVEQKESIELPDQQQFLRSLAYTLGQRRSRFPVRGVLSFPLLSSPYLYVYNLLLRLLTLGEWCCSGLRHTRFRSPKASTQSSEHLTLLHSNPTATRVGPESAWSLQARAHSGTQVGAIFNMITHHPLKEKVE